jgi:hypothetical protein
MDECKGFPLAINPKHQQGILIYMTGYFFIFDEKLRAIFYTEIDSSIND